MAEAIRVQVEMKVKPSKGLAVSKELAEEVLQKWIRVGTLPPGFSVKAIHWQRENGGKGSARTQASIDTAVRVLLRHIPFHFSKIRIS